MSKHAATSARRDQPQQRVVATNSSCPTQGQRTGMSYFEPDDHKLSMAILHIFGHSRLEIHTAALF